MLNIPFQPLEPVFPQSLALIALNMLQVVTWSALYVTLQQ